MTVPLSKKQVGHLVTEANTLDPEWNEAGFTALPVSRGDRSSVLETATSLVAL